MTGGRIRRWRHRRGFGVHSPLAFRLVKDVFRLPARYGFYGEAELRRMGKERKIGEEGVLKAILMLRLTATLGLKSFHSTAQPDIMTEKAMRLAGCRKRPAEDADFLLDTTGKAGEEETDSFLSRPGRVVWTAGNPVDNSSPGRLTLLFPDFRLIISRRGMAPTPYDF